MIVGVSVLIVYSLSSYASYDMNSVLRMQKFCNVLVCEDFMKLKIDSKPKKVKRKKIVNWMYGVSTIGDVIEY